MSVEIKTFDDVGYNTNGTYVQAMSAFTKERYYPLEMIPIMVKIIEAINSKDKAKIDFWFNYHGIDSACPVGVYRGRFVVNHHASKLNLEINENTRLGSSGYRYSLTENRLQLLEYEGSNILDISDNYWLNQDLSRKQAKDNWNKWFSKLSDTNKLMVCGRELTEKEILDEYISSVFDFINIEDDGKDRAMGLFIGEENGLGALTICKQGNYKSTDFNGSNAHLVGIFKDKNAKYNIDESSFLKRFGLDSIITAGNISREYIKLNKLYHYRR